MDVVHHFEKSVRLDDVPIVPASRLPEQAFRSLAAPPGQSREPLGRMPRQVVHGATTDRFLHSPEYPGNRVRILSRHDNHVYVFGHENVRPQMESAFEPGCVDCLGEPSANHGSRKELVAAVAREREFVGVSWNVEGRSIGHAEKVPRSEWELQGVVRSEVTSAGALRR